MSEAWRELGTARAGGLLLIADHASAHVPDDIDLGINPTLLDDHIALDIGVAEVATLLVDRGAVGGALLGGVSRLVLDLNREEDHPGLIPLSSDGHVIHGNQALDSTARAVRIARFFAPYHARLDELIAATRPAMILSLHSFTPRLASRPDERRPWDIGVLYNQDERLAAAAIAILAADGWHVGDQLPYSGKLLNATMNRHAEARDIPYIGIEMRQDHSGLAAGQAAMAASLAKMLGELRNRLA
ncbi:MAG: N-formylglutamate amidohydrolase [Sphingopyxis sp.]|nr:N-formylglutamate amidohydrolase [Sphingopyxis sp.]